MVEAEALAVLRETLIGADSIPSKLALMRGIDRDAVARLDRAFDVLIPMYRGKPSVPKVIAQALLDLGARFDRTYTLYDDATGIEIEDIKLHITDRAYDLLYGTNDRTPADKP